MTTEQAELKQGVSRSGLKNLLDDINDLLTKHVELFAYEIKTETKLTVKIVVAVIISAIAAYTGFVFFGFFALILLSVFLSPVMSALVVTGAYLIFSVLLLLKAKSYLSGIKHSNESIKGQVTKTMECAKKWFQELK